MGWELPLTSVNPQSKGTEWVGESFPAKQGSEVRRESSGEWDLGRNSRPLWFSHLHCLSLSGQKAEVTHLIRPSKGPFCPQVLFMTVVTGSL